MGKLLTLAQQPHTGDGVTLPERELAVDHECPGTQGRRRGAWASAWSSQCRTSPKTPWATQ